MKSVLLFALVVSLVALAAPAEAQTAIRNPTVGEFSPSPDHAQGITRYSIGFFLPGATDPVQEIDLGLPQPSGSPAVCTVTLNTQPLTFAAAYTAKVRAWAGTLASDWSPASNPFDRVPGPPSKPVIR